MAELGTREQRVIGIDEPLVTTPVGAQGGPGRCVGGGAKVGEDVGPPKGVDGLFRITDEHQGRAARSEGPAHDVPLDQVRVLELVDQGDVETGPQPADDGQAPLRVRQGVVEPGEEVVVGHQPGLTGTSLDLVADRLGQASPHRWSALVGAERREDLG